KNAGTTGNGVEVQATANTPDWLTKIIGKGGVSNFFTDQSGNLVFGTNVGSSNGKYYTLTTDANGLHGLFEHTIDGKIALAGGDYGFNAGAAQLLINQGQQLQQKISMQQQMQQAELKLAQPPALPSISVSAPAVLPSISIPRVSA